jgi:hypothetical protein
MKALDVICPRCGRDDHWGDRCWMCGTSLEGVAPSPRPLAAVTRRGKVEGAGVTVVTVLATSIVMAVLAPLLLIVTCYGAVFLDAFGHMGR